MSEEWRLEVELNDEQHGFSLSERLRAVDLDDEARKRLGDRVIVTRDGSRLYLYATGEANAREAARVVQDLLEQDDLTAEVTLTRWHPVEEAWKDPSVPLPSTPEGVAREEAAAHYAAALNHDYDWVVRIEVPRHRQAVDFARSLADAGLDVYRQWKYVLVGVPTENDARELAAQLTGDAPAGSTVEVARNVALPGAGFVFLEAHKPDIARDLGL